MKAMSNPNFTPSDEDLLEMLSDPSNPFAPRRGEWDASVRSKEIESLVHGSCAQEQLGHEVVAFFVIRKVGFDQRTGALLNR